MNTLERDNRTAGEAIIVPQEAHVPRPWVPLQTDDYIRATPSERIREAIRKLCPNDGSPLTANKLLGLVCSELVTRGAISKVLSLGIGLPRGLPSLPGIKTGHERIAANPELLETYAPTLGHTSTRRAVAEQASRKSRVTIREDEVMITHGAENGLHIVLSTLAHKRPGSEGLFIGPAFPTYATLAEQLKMRASYSQTIRKKDGNYELDSEDLKKQITPNTRALVLSSPGNPTGHMLSQSEFEAIIALARQHQFKIIIDDPYSFSIFDDKGYCDPLTLFPEAKDVVIIIQSCSKQFGIPGERIGWVFAEEELLKKVRGPQDGSILAPSTSGMIVLDEILRDPATPDVMGKRLEELRQRRELIMSRFAKLADLFDVSWPKATYYCFARLKLADNNDLAFCLRLLEEAGVIVLPGSGFGPSGKGFVRFCFGYTPNEINAAFDAIDHWWEKSKGHFERE